MTVIQRLKDFYGQAIEIRIEDLAGNDPIAPPIHKKLDHVAFDEEGTHLKFYFNATQFLAIPYFDDDRTTLEKLAIRPKFVSHDTAGQLVYSVYFH